MRIEENKSLKPYNTFGLAVKAAFFVEVTTIDELQKALSHNVVAQQPLMILGGGSNVLFTQDFPGLVIKNNISGISVIKETDHAAYVKVGAGENWHQFVLHALSNDWGGLENLSLIPGTVGAAPMQNIGAYGVEIENVFDHLIAVNLKTKAIEKFDKNQCQFGYRESVFKNILKDQYVIGEVVFKLTKQQHHLNTSYGAITDTLDTMGITTPSIQNISQAVIHIRQSKLPDPAKIGNAGSFFKNPTLDNETFGKLKTTYPALPGYPTSEGHTKVPAGWLIEQCGWKGTVRDNIGVHKNQALVLVNYGGGKGSELLKLAKDIQQSVIDKFGVTLMPEVNFI